MQIYLDNAATTKMSEHAIQAMLPYMNEIFGNPSSLHSAGQQANEALTDARTRIARLLNAEPSEITFTSGGSEADNQALVSAARLGEKHGKRHIISSAFEHHAVLHTLDKLQKEGFEVTLLDVQEDGLIRLEQVAEAIRPDTQPIAEIGALCHERGILFHTDAVQAVGHLNIDVKVQQIDMLSLSAHKFHGPKGAGVLYSRKNIPLTTLIEGGAQERHKRAGTENIPAIMGMAAAMEDACAHLAENASKIGALRDRLIQGLSEIPHAVLNGDAEKRLPGNVHFCFEGIEGESLLLFLNDKGICASSSSACTSGSLDPSHVLLAIGRPHEIAHGSLRLSLSEETTEADIDTTIQAVKDVVSRLRSMSPVWRDLQEGKRNYLI